ncbi:metallophosphoesterase, partial [Mariprofundus sp. EBB-1]
MHISDENIPIIEHVDSIVNSIKNLDYNIGVVLVIVSGDITFSGQDDEFLIAIDLLETIRDKLSTATNAPAYCIPVPGNHDCNFTSSRAREFIVKKLKEDNFNKIDDEVIAVCLEPQSEFIQFRDSFVSSKNISVDEPLFYQYIFDLDGDQVEINCINTAWVSLRHETPGTLYFPMDCHPELEHNSSIVISVFHHPYQWLAPNNAREFREKIESYSDMIFTGHEHTSTKSVIERDDGPRMSYIEGGALHDTHYGSESTFNAIVVDIEGRKQKFSRMKWDGHKYLSTIPLHEDNCGMGLRWDQLPTNRARSGNHSEVNQGMADYLDDPCVSLMQKNRGVSAPITLSDIFVAPDVKITSNKGSEKGEKIKGENLFDFAYQNPRLLITGESQSGKTTLSKSFFKWFLKEGFLPIIIDEND